MSAERAADAHAEARDVRRRWLVAIVGANTVVVLVVLSAWLVLGRPRDMTTPEALGSCLAQAQTDDPREGVDVERPVLRDLELVDDLRVAVDVEVDEEPGRARLSCTFTVETDDDGDDQVVLLEGRWASR